MVTAALGVSLLIGCNKKDFEGRAINTASENFQVITDLQISDNTPDFVSGPIHFTAEYNESVTSTIDIIGLESGAVKKVVVDNSDTLTASNTEWNGNHDGLYFFKTGEKAVYTLSFFGSDITYTDTITITQAYDFMKENVSVAVPNGDFELDPTFANGEWFVGGRAVFWNQNTVTDIFPVQGDGFLYAEGQRSESSAYMDGASQGQRNGEFFDLPVDASRVWVNAYSYGFGLDNAHTNLYLVFLEADSVGLETPNPTNTDGIDDGVLWTVPSTHDGWALQSVRYSDIPFSTYCVDGAAGGGCGNKVKEPNRIDLLAVSFESDDFTKTSYGAVDFIIFTIDEPLDPSKF